MTITFVREFVGYYTNLGPKGYVSATSSEKAVELARTVAESWDDMVVGEPYKRMFDPKDRYFVQLGPK